MGARRLSALVTGLPPDSALMRSVHPDEWQWGTAAGRWGSTTELLAALVEVVDVGNRYFIMANSPKGQRAPAPIVVPRPGDDRRRKQLSEAAEVRAFFGAGTVVVDGSKQEEGEGRVVPS